MNKDLQIPENYIRRRGDFWLISFDGKEIIMKHTKGLAYLSYLLKQPNVIIPLLSLAQHDLPGNLRAGEMMTKGGRLSQEGLDNLSATLWLSKRAYPAVSKAIHRAFDNIDKFHPGLAKHLRVAIKPITIRPCYSVYPPIKWEVSF